MGGQNVDFRVGDAVRLKKAHACGSDRWEVVRLGADIGLRCLRCERRILVGRGELGRKLSKRRS